MLTSLIAACAGCAAPKPVPGRTSAAAANRPSVAGLATAPAPRPVPYGVTCRPAALRLAPGPRMSEATQQETIVFTLTNVSAAGCDLWGYPGVSLLTRGGLPLPFHVRWGGDQMLTSAPPVLVPLAPDGNAYVGINKNACVGHAYRTAHLFELIPPNDYQPLSFITGRYPYIDYCRPHDPGHTVDVSPVEPTLRGVLNLALTGGSR